MLRYFSIFWETTANLILKIYIFIYVLAFPSIFLLLCKGLANRFAVLPFFELFWPVFLKGVQAFSPSPFGSAPSSCTLKYLAVRSTSPFLWLHTTLCPAQSHISLHFSFSSYVDCAYFGAKCCISNVICMSVIIYIFCKYILTSTQW